MFSTSTISRHRQFYFEASRVHYRISQLFYIRCRDRGAWCRDVIRSQQAWSSSRRVWRSTGILSRSSSSRRQRKTSGYRGGTDRSGWIRGSSCATRRLWSSWRNASQHLGRSLGLWYWRPSYRAMAPVNPPLYLRENTDFTPDVEISKVPAMSNFLCRQ